MAEIARKNRYNTTKRNSDSEVFGLQGTVEQYRWLVSDEARDLLRDHAGRADERLKLVEILRRQLPPERAALLCEELDLRSRAAVKFAAADRMFFTRRGLEQASGEVVAAYKAERYAPATHIADLCCGIGGDLLSLANHETTGTTKTVVGVDRDEIAAILARANCAQLGRIAEIETSDVAATDIARFDAWHIDPDRRSNGRRVTHVESIEPPLSDLDGLLGRNRNAGLKLAPATDAPDQWQEAAELEWISWQRECRQQVAWFGDLATAGNQATNGLRRATCLSRDGSHRTSIIGRPDTGSAVATDVARYVYDPDPAVLAAGLNFALAAKCELSALGPDGLYLTGDRHVVNQPLTGFEVIEVISADLRKVKQLFAAHSLRKVEVKKRGVPNEVADRVRHIKTNGDRDATLILAQPRDQVIAILAQRVDM